MDRSTCVAGTVGKPQVRAYMLSFMNARRMRADELGWLLSVAARSRGEGVTGTLSLGKASMMIMLRPS